MTSLADFDIKLNIDPPRDEPGKRYILVKDNCDHIEAVNIAVQCRRTHPAEAVEIWVKSDTLRTVVREAVK